MKKFKFLLLTIFWVMIFLSTAFAENSPAEHNIKTVLNIEFCKQYHYPNSFNLIGANVTSNNKGATITCNDGKIILFQKSYGLIDYILIKDPLVTLYGMEMGKTNWNDEIVENAYFIRRDISPNGKTITAYYQSDTDKSVYYRVVFEANSHKNSPVFSNFEKDYIH